MRRARTALILPPRALMITRARSEKDGNQSSSGPLVALSEDRGSESSLSASSASSAPTVLHSSSSGTAGAPSEPTEPTAKTRFTVAVFWREMERRNDPPWLTMPRSFASSLACCAMVFACSSRSSCCFRIFRRSVS